MEERKPDEEKLGNIEKYLLSEEDARVKKMKDEESHLLVLEDRKKAVLEDRKKAVEDKNIDKIMNLTKPKSKSTPIKKINKPTK